MASSLKDTDPFPFGQWKGTPMQDVPAEYLDWLSDQDWISKWPRVRAYIDHNRAVIDKELEDPDSFGGSHRD